MNILWICGTHRLGGAETATLELMRRLQEHAHMVTVLCHPDSPVRRAAHETGLSIRPASIGREIDPRTWLAVAAALRTPVPDVALVSTITEWMPACLARRHRATALVLVRHMALPLSRRVRWIAQRRADALVAVSHVVREILCRDGLPSVDQVPVIYNPIRFAPSASPSNHERRVASRVTLGIEPSGRWVAFCGGLDAKKGVLDVVDAVRAVAAVVPDTRLLVCGPRNPRDTAISETVRNASGVTYIGEIDHIDTVYDAADVVVMATRSELSEALPATLLEAMARGTPVVGYATGGIAEVIGTDGDAGRLARADDAADLGRVIVDVLRDREGTTQMATRALARIRAVFDADCIVAEYEALFTRARRGVRRP